jgi:transcriptional regulator with PAS, ATPase and Fis domain
MRKIRILAVAPYTGMQETAELIASKKGNIELNTFQGNIVEIDHIMNEIEQNNYDIIVSRGGTARAIVKRTTIPTVEISISVYDILRVIKTAGTFTGKYAIVGAANITDTAKHLCDFLQYDIDVFQATGKKAVYTCINRLKSEGYLMIIGDALANMAAKEFSLNSLLITSGYEGVEEAFEQAIAIYRSYTHIKRENQLYRQALDFSPLSTLILNESNKIIYNSFIENNYSEKIFKLIYKSLENFWKREKSSCEQIIDDKLCRINTHVDASQKERFLHIYVMLTYVPTVLSDPAIRLVTTSFDTEEPLISLLTTSNSMNKLNETIVSFGNASQTTLIVGEHGTEKESIAYMLYDNSKYNQNPFYAIDCNNVRKELEPTYNQY